MTFDEGEGPKGPTGGERDAGLRACPGELINAPYNEGEGVPQDYVEAHMWYNLAASQLTGEARELVVENRD